MTSPGDKSHGDRLVLLGQIGPAHGVRGEVMIRSFTADPIGIASYGPLTDKANQRRFVLKSVRATDKALVARIDGVSDRNAAEALRGVELYVARSALPPADEAEYYHADLVGLNAVTVSGESYGQVVAVQNFGAGDLLEIKRGDGETEFIPFTHAHAPVVDLAQNLVTIDPPVLVGDAEPASNDEHS